jgi:cytoskeletal protein RodZ
MAENKRFRPVVEELNSQAPQPAPSTPMETPSPVSAPPITPPPQNIPSGIPVANDPPPPQGTVNSISNSTSHKKGINLKMVVIITVLTAVIVGVVAGAIYVFFSRNQSKTDLMSQETSQTEITSPLPSAAPSPSPSASPQTNVEDLNIKILNGSGKIGEAAKVSDLLGEDGFIVKSTANADRYDYQKTLVEAKPSISQEVLTKIEKLLTNTGYTVETKSDLSDSGEFDLVITVGQD